MEGNKIRYIVIAVLFALFAAGILFGVQGGTLCGFGVDSIAILCPVGALLTMIAARTLIPRALVSLVLILALVFLVGRAFCGWVCPVTLWNRVKAFFTPKAKAAEELAARDEANRAIGRTEIDREMAKIKAEMGEACGEGCASCASAGCPGKRKALDSRHAVLGGAILSTAIFGFPVFCLVCPVGLSFATVVLLLGLFGMGDLNWGIVFAPAMLILELVVFRKWCSRWCPISALMNLVSRFSRTTLPEIDNAKCLETSKGAACSKCATACSYGINLRHPEYGELGLADCTRCGDCVKACPAQAIRIVAVNKRKGTFELQLPASEVPAKTE